MRTKTTGKIDHLITTVLRSRAKFEQSVDIYIYKLKKLVFPRISELVSETEFSTMHQG